MKYAYELIVDGDDGDWTARLDDEQTPLRGHGESPLQAIRSLCEAIREWPISGADRWLSTSGGVRLARLFVPEFEPAKQGKPS